MRKWHRWLSVFFGVFLVWMAFTGVASHVAAMVAQGSIFEQEEERKPEGLAAKASEEGVAVAVAVAGVGAVPQNEAPRKAPNAKRKWVGFFHHLHSGETFGPVGTLISLFSGVALLFFAISGLWMYVQMWRNRKLRGLNPKWLWD
jgi:hypothetical protein